MTSRDHAITERGVTVDNYIASRHTANGILKDAEEV